MYIKVNFFGNLRNVHFIVGIIQQVQKFIFECLLSNKLNVLSLSLCRRRENILLKKCPQDKRLKKKISYNMHLGRALQILNL